MPDTDTIDRVESRKVQVASLPPADSGRGFARLPDSLMEALGLSEGDVIEIDRRARDPSVRRRRGHRHHPPRWSPARQRGSRFGRFRRGSQGGVKTGDARRVRARPAERPPAGIGRRAQTDLRRPPADRGRHRLHGRPSAGQRRRPRPHPADAQRSRLRASGVAAGGDGEHAQGHRPYRRQDRRRASLRIYRG